MRYSTDYAYNHADYTSRRPRPAHSRRSSRRGRARRRTSYLNPFTLLVAAVAVVLLVTFSIRTVNASDKDDKNMYKYYTSITVSADDTLWSIADRYAYNESNKDYVNHIISLNNMSGDTIYSGQDLVIYYFSEELK